MLIQEEIKLLIQKVLFLKIKFSNMILFEYSADIEIIELLV